MATWPSNLQQKVEATQFDLTFGETRIKTDVDVGPVKVRSRFTDGIDEYRATIFLDSSEYATLKTFYKTTLNNGTNYFDWVDPVDQTAAQFRFLNPPRITGMGGSKFNVSLALEKLP